MINSGISCPKNVAPRLPNGRSLRKVGLGPIEVFKSVANSSDAAIAEHQRQTDTIRALQQHLHNATAENDMLRRELQAVQGSRMSEMGPSTPHATQNGSQGPSQPPAQQGPYSSEQYGGSRTELPPLRSISTSIPTGPDSMTGVQYEPPRVNGYRGPEARY